MKKGGIDPKTARSVLDRWKEAGAEGDPNELRKLFLKQSLVPISATLVQVCLSGRERKREKGRSWVPPLSTRGNLSLEAPASITNQLLVRSLQTTGIFVPFLN